MGKTLLALNIATNIGSVTWLAFDEPPEDIYEKLVARGVKNIVILDGYTPVEMLRRGRWNKIESFDIYGIINEVMKSALKNSAIVVDSINEIVLRASTGIIEFFKAMKLLARRFDAITVFTVHTDIEEVASSTLTAMHLTDAVIEMDINEDGSYTRKIRLSHYRYGRAPSQWLRYDISGGQLKIIDQGINACQT